MKYHVIVYGCQMNFADAERLCAIFEHDGYKKTSSINEADLVAIVMCSVRQASVDRIFGLVEKFKKLKNKPRTMLTGCILKRDKKIFSEFFDYVLPISEVTNPKRGNKLFVVPGPLVPAGTKGVYQQTEKSLLPSIKSLANEKAKAYITISNGCNNFCTYCVVPYTRGRLVCRNHNEIIKDVKNLIKNGYKEIWLLGQNVNDYNSPKDKSIDFAELLKMVDNLSGEFKIFFMSPNPKNFSDKLISVMKECKKFSKYLNLPVQSGDDEILKKMNRPYTAKQYIDLVKKIREAIPDINLSTDVIVGFPGETKKHFESTLKLFKKIKFNVAYINKYSPRKGTASFNMKDSIPFSEKKKREQILIKLVNEK